MFRPIIIGGAFVGVTVGLILRQPDTTPAPFAALPSVPAEALEVAPVVLATPDLPEQAAAAPPTELLRPIEADLLDVVPEVTRSIPFADIRPVLRPERAAEAEPEAAVLRIEDAPAEIIVEPAAAPLAAPLGTPLEAPAEAPVPDLAESASEEDRLDAEDALALAVAEAPAVLAASPGAEPVFPPDFVLFADVAASRPNLLTATGTDALGTLAPSLKSIAHNSKIYPAETASRDVSLMSLDINADRSAPAPMGQASPVSVARSFSRETVTLTTRMANSPATLPVADAIAAPTVEAAPEFTAVADEADAPLLLEGATDVVATLGAPEEVGNAELRAKLANAPTRAVHTVRLGDSLLTLALRYYGDGEKAEMILEANRRHVADDGSLLIGQILRIPDIDNL